MRTFIVLCQQPPSPHTHLTNYPVLCLRCGHWQLKLSLFLISPSKSFQQLWKFSIHVTVRACYLQAGGSHSHKNTFATTEVLLDFLQVSSLSFFSVTWKNGFELDIKNGWTSQSSMLQNRLSWVIYKIGITGVSDVWGKHFWRQGNGKNGFFNPFPKMTITLHPSTML